MEDSVQNFIDWFSGVIWNQYFIYGFLLIGLYFTLATKFVQVRYLKDMFRLTFERKSSKSGISSFQAISMSLGSRVGTGNIAGVATAITLGGPGAVFWMWVMAFMGSATSFVEVTLAQIFKSKQDGEYRGGTPYYIEKGLGWTKLAIFFALLTIVAKGFLLMNIQSNTVALSMKQAFGIEPVVVGVVLTVLLSLVIFGGVKRIAQTLEFLVPIMVVLFFLVTAVVLTANITLIPEVFRLIISSAVGTDAAFGGLIGSAVAWGVQRGFFSNAAGSGGETYEGAAAEVSHPAKQGLVQSMSVYIDTWLICSATAFMILISGMYNVQPSGGDAVVANVPGVEAGPVNTQLAVDSVLPGFGSPFLAIALFFFCFTTMLSYYYKSETGLAFIQQRLGRKFFGDGLLKTGILIFVFTGSVVSASTAWTLGDIGLGSMAYINMLAIVLLAKPALIALKDYGEQRKAGKDPVFEPERLGIRNADFWETERPQSSNPDLGKKRKAPEKKRGVALNFYDDAGSTVRK